MRNGAVFLVLATLLWSGNYIAGRVLAHAISPFALNGIRWVVSAAILLLIARKMRRRVPLLAKWRAFATLGLLGMFLFSALTYLGLQTVPAAQAGMLSAVMPVFILLLSVAIVGERPGFLSWGGVALSAAGVAMLLGGGIQFSGGAAELLSAALCWGLYTVLGKRFSRDGTDPLTMTTGAAVYGAVPSAIAGILTARSGISLQGAGDWASLAYVCTMSSVVAYFVWNHGVHLTGPSRSGPFMNLLPVWTAVLGMLMLGEQITVLQGFGGFLTVFGAVLAGRKRRAEAVRPSRSEAG